MLWSSRRAIFSLIVLATLIGLCAVLPTSAQVKGKKAVGPIAPGAPGVPPKQKGYDLGSLTLPKDDDLKEKIEAAQDRIKEKDWKRACDTLQALINRHEDIFVPVTRPAADGGEATGYVSVKKEAARLISTLPKPGRDMYETTFGEKASNMVKRARTNNDRTEMAQAMSLFLYTEAGAEAATWLGTYYLDRADFRQAANFFQQLINRGGFADIKPRTLLKAAYAFHHAGDKPARDLVFKELDRRGIEVKLGTEAKSVGDIQESINKMVVRVSIQSASDSPIYRGRPNRTAMLPGGTPFLEPSWKQNMVKSDATKEQIKRAETMLATRNIPVLSSFTPVTATMTKGEKKIPLLIYRSYWGIHGVEMKTGKLAWDGRSELSMDHVLGATGRDRDSYKVGAYTQWLNSFLVSNGGRPQILFENSTAGTLATDSKMVYAVDDIALPPPQQFTGMNPGGFGGAMAPGAGYNWGPELTKFVQHNRLQAFDLTKDGKLAWEIGAPDEKSSLAESFFLGPPLPLHNRLYVLNEKQQELRLAAIDPTNGKMIGLQPLANTKDLKLWQEPLRRVQACQLAYGEGVLVVPTNAGAIFGVDLLSNSLLWAYPYREKPAAGAAGPQPGVMPPGMAIGRRGGMMIGPDMKTMETHWIVTAPVIVEGRTVFTAPDSKEVHCVNLRDGSRAWSVTRRPDDLYLAGVFTDKVIVVGKTRTRALSLAKGEVFWELETGLPSGQGAAGAPDANGDIIYYLPIREAVNTREPEICAINVTKGRIQAHTRSRKKEVPGNLLFYEGNVIAQNHTEVVAYPQLELQLAKMDSTLKERPNDPVALTERGDYLLDKGDLKGAIADFRRALKNSPPEGTSQKARTKLYEAFTEQFQIDFAKAEEYLPEYEEMCKIDLTGKTGAERAALETEARRRRANFLCLVGKGREGQNRLVEAFEKYLELGMEAKKDELIQVIDEPSVKSAPDIWSQGRIAAMVANAQDPKQKKALEDLITQKWTAIKMNPNPTLDELRNFVNLFGSLFDVGKEARLALADRLMSDTDVGSILEAEQQLSLLRGDGEKPEIAARAIEALARLNAQKGLLEDAAWYYRLLGERYPKIPVRGMTGQEYLDDLATDKRFLPYLDQAGRFLLKGKVDLRHKEESSGATVGLIYQFGHSGEALPFFSRHKVTIDAGNNHQLRLTDIATGSERWKLSLTRTQFLQITQGNTQSYRAKFNYQSVGHLMVLQLGHMVYGVDPLNKGRVLWEKNLSSLPNATTSAPYPESNTFDERDNSVVLRYSDGWMQRLGENGPLQGSVVCLTMRDSLSAIDPMSGRLLWSRTDVNSRSKVFGDGEHLFVVNLADDGSASGTRIYRAYDGVSVQSRDFSAVYQKRIRMQGRTILASDTDNKGIVTLRLYDVLTGTDLWTKTYPAQSVLLRSEDPRLAGVCEVDGTVHVFDIAERKEVATLKLMDRKHIQNAQAVQLVSDPDYLFVAVNGAADPNVSGGVHPPFLAGSGLRSIPVNGMVYCFERKSGRLNWFNPIESSHMVVSQFEDLPMVLFTARYNQSPQGRIVGGGGGQFQKAMARAIAKHNGKLWYDQPMLNINVNFHALTMDHRTGTVELSGNQLKVTMTANPK